MIKLTNVTKIYNENNYKALDDISLIIPENKFTIIIGDSGSGKTTLLKILGAIHKPTSGKVIVLDEEIDKLNDKYLTKFRKDNIGFIFQDFLLEPNYTVFQNVCVPLILDGVSLKERKEEVSKILDKLGLLDKINDKAKNLSGGQQQRVSIARALIKEPKIIIADEPTGNLDENQGDNIIKTLKDLSSYKTVIMVTHNKEYLKYADNVINIEDGMIKK